MRRPTRLRTKRGNRQAGQQLMTGPRGERTKRGNRQATRVRTGLSLRSGVLAVSGVMAVQTSAGRPPARILPLPTLGSSGLLQRFERFLDLRRGMITMQEVAQLRERELTGIIQQSAMNPLRERDTRRVAERPLSTPRGIVPHGERRLRDARP